MRRWRVAVAIIAVGLLGSVQSTPSAAGAPVRLAAPVQGTPATDGGGTSLKAEYDEVIGQEADLLARINRARAKQDQLTRDLDKLAKEVEAKQAELLDAQIRLQQAEEKAAAELVARNVAERKVNQAQDRLRRQIVASYVSGDQGADVLEAILRADNGAEAGNALAYSRAIVGDTDALVRALEKARAERRRADKAAKKAKARAEVRRNDIADTTTLLAAARDQQATLVDGINAEVVAENVALNEVKGRKAVVEGQIASMNRTSDGVAVLLATFQAGQPAWKAGDVHITNPIPGYQVGSKFGLRKHPILGTVRLHAGADMGAPGGTVIYAPADGLVVLAGPRGGYGNATVIDHGSSLATLYGHQSRVLVKPGQRVKRGDPIGVVGSTGLSTGPHLHFETRLKGLPTDPEAIVDFALPKVSYAEELRLFQLAAAGN